MYSSVVTQHENWTADMTNSVDSLFMYRVSHSSPLSLYVNKRTVNVELAEPLPPKLRTKKEDVLRYSVNRVITIQQSQ
jgi:hypothetical protein